MSEIKATEIEISKVKMEPGQVLVVKVYADDTSAFDLATLKAQLKAYFPSNKIMLFALPTDGRIEMDILDLAAPKVPTIEMCGPEPSSFCSDCGCGKKEAFEGIKK